MAGQNWRLFRVMTINRHWQLFYSNCTTSMAAGFFTHILFQAVMQNSSKKCIIIVNHDISERGHKELLYDIMFTKFRANSTQIDTSQQCMCMSAPSDTLHMVSR